MAKPFSRAEMRVLRRTVGWPIVCHRHPSWKYNWLISRASCIMHPLPVSAHEPWHIYYTKTARHLLPTQKHMIRFLNLIGLLGGDAEYRTGIGIVGWNGRNGQCDPYGLLFRFLCNILHPHSIHTKRVHVATLLFFSNDVVWTEICEVSGFTIRNFKRCSEM